MAGIEGRKPGISIRGVTCTVMNCVVHHNTDAGIGNVGGPGRIASPMIRANVVYGNVVGGIGAANGVQPVVRENSCYQNLRAGIGCSTGAPPLISRSLCQENEMAGIGIGQEAHATIVDNRCLANKLVAIGVVGASSAVMPDTALLRMDSTAPLVAIRDSSSAKLRNIRLTWSGVAAVLVPGTAQLEDNRFQGKGASQGTADGAWDGSTLLVTGNHLEGYRIALNARESCVTVLDSLINKFTRSAIIVSTARHNRPVSSAIRRSRTNPGHGSWILRARQTWCATIPCRATRGLERK